MADDSKFAGFSPPISNFTRIPNAFWQIADLDSYERDVLLYVLRHTWGFYDDDGKPKKITIDEFENGRKRKDESRFDAGLPMSRGKIHKSLGVLEAKGYIVVETDDADKARVKKYYKVHMGNADYIDVTEDNQRSPHERYSSPHERYSSPHERDQRKKPKKETNESLSVASDDALGRALFEKIGVAYKLGAGSKLTPHIFNLLTGRAKTGEWAKYKFEGDTVVTPQEFVAFVVWYHRTFRDANGGAFALPQKPLSINTQICQFRESKHYNYYVRQFDELGERVQTTKLKHEASITDDDFLANAIIPMEGN